MSERPPQEEDRRAAPIAGSAAETELMGRWMVRRPLPPIARGEGSWLIARDGTRILDLTSGYGTAPLGHAHPHLAAALADQAATLWSAPGFLLAEVRERYLQALVRVLPGSLERVFLTNSGTEAVEAGLKFARLATGRGGVVAVRGSFHGRTLGALATTSNAKARAPEEVLESSAVRFVRRDDIEGLESTVDDSVAAVVVEVVQGEGGVFPCAPEFLQAARDVTKERGALLLVDEIQTGFGRTGAMWGCEHAGITPDLMALAKGIGGGFPLGALAYTAEVEGALTPGAHGSTYGGNALACRAGTAVLEVFEREDLVAQAAATGAWLLDQLHARFESVARVREVRGLGLMVALQLRERAGKYLAQLAREHHVLALPAGPNVIRLLPPLNVSREELEQGLEALEAVVGAAAEGDA